MQLLNQLTRTPGTPGREHRVRELVRERVEPLVDELRVDPMGSLIGVRRPRPGDAGRGGQGAGADAKKPLKVMLIAHMDQIGFLVRHIDEKGFVRVQPTGGFDPRNLFARKVRVCTEDGDLPGVMNPSAKPIHIATAEERKKVPEMHEFFIDLGLDAEQVKKKVRLGDMVVLDAPFEEVGDRVVAQCLDNRIGCWVLIRVLEQLTDHACEIHAVWSVQEEVGLRGAGPATFGVEPDIGLSCDTTVSSEVPGVPEDQHVTALGQGVCLKVMDSSTIPDIELVEDIERVARANQIPWQRGVLPRGGQDGAMVQRSRIGVRTGVFAAPVRYIHTVTEMAAQSDIHAYRDLLIAWLAQA